MLSMKVGLVYDLRVVDFLTPFQNPKLETNPYKTLTLTVEFMVESQEEVLGPLS